MEDRKRNFRKFIWKLNSQNKLKLRYKEIMEETGYSE